MLCLKLLLVAVPFVIVVEGKKCEDGYFTCKNGYCIQKKNQCDMFPDCDDNSDEEGCQKVCSEVKKLRKGRTVLIGAKKGHQILPGVIAKSICKKGYRLVGSKKRTCKEDGKWSGFIAKCISQESKRIFCPAPKYFRNGIIHGNKLSEGSKIRYQCHKDFQITGPIWRICQSNGMWSREAPFCDAKYCKDPGQTLNGVRVGVAPTYSEGQFLRYVCYSGFRLIGQNTITCQKGGFWDALLPKCISKEEALKLDAKDIKKTFVNRLKLLTTDGAGRSAGMSASARGIDLIFMVDYSDSVGKVNFEKSLDFVEKMVQYFGISANEQGTHVALIVFSNAVKVVFNLKDEKIFDKTIAMEELSYLKFSGGGTATRLAFDVVREQLIPQTRKTAKKVLFLITDGNYNIGGDPSSNAKFLREQGFEIYTVGVSNNVDRDNLEQLASLPFQRHVWMMQNYEMLDKLKELVNKSSVDYSSCGQGGDTKSKDPAKDAVTTVQGAWPWVVTIEIDGVVACAGVLLEERFVLTAASCVDSVNPSSITIVAGVHSRSEFTGSEQRRAISKVITYKGKHAEAATHLILLKIKKKVEFNEYARAVCLPEKYDYVLSVRPTKNAFVVGWGTEYHVHLDQTQGFLEIVSNTKCKAAFQQSGITESNICAKAAFSGNAACAATKGAPLLIQRTRFVRSDRETYSWFLAGIVQKNRGCEGRRYTVFTDVYKAKSWLEGILKKAKKG